MRRCAVLLCALATGCGPRPDTAPISAAPAAPVVFTDVTKSAGIDFRHVNGATGKKYLPETMGSGCAFLDYDRDGLLDIFLVNGRPWQPGLGSPSAESRLYRNLGGERFQDVTERAGLRFSAYGMGVAVGDFDNDGWDDLYVTALGRSRLFHNTPAPGGRAFRDVTDAAGVASPGWATSATWVDYNRDGRLDLFVCHYVRWSPETNRFFSIDGVNRTYSTPEQYPGETCRLYRNEDGGRFTDVTRESGVYSARSKALGVVAWDFDQDGWQDILVANDTEPNFLFHNQANGTFKEVALELGVAVSHEGKAKAGMGVDVGDEQNIGWESIAITNFSGEQMSLFRREPSGSYVDAAARSGIGSATQLYLGFGVIFFDYDLDGWLDLFVANGHIQSDVGVRQTGVLYREPPLLLRNVRAASGRGFVAANDRAGKALSEPRVARGLAWGDFDNDGDPDLLIASNQGEPEARLESGGRPALLRNDGGKNSWLRVELEGTESPRNAYGARVRVIAGDLAQTQSVKAGSSYLSQSDRRLLFGLGGAQQADSLEIQWPSGRVQAVGPVRANGTLRVREGR